MAMTRPTSRIVTALDRLLIPGDLLMTVRATTRGHSLLVDRGARLSYETAGSGSTPILFVSGDVPASRVFRPQLAYFDASTTVRALALDSRGPDRSAGHSGPPAARRRAQDLDQIVRYLDLREIVLVGWSGGVGDALGYVRAFGYERLKALVLVDWGPRSASMRPEAGWTSVITSAGVPVADDETDYVPDLMALDGIVPLLFTVPDVLREIVAEWADTHTPSAYVVGIDRPASPRRPPIELCSLLERFLSILPDGTRNRMRISVRSGGRI
jgi:pimeloyl-ACP methyl ester carboxylesterase